MACSLLGKRPEGSIVSVDRSMLNRLIKAVLEDRDGLAEVAATVKNNTAWPLDGTTRNKRSFECAVVTRTRPRHNAHDLARLFVKKWCDLLRLAIESFSVSVRVRSA